MKKSLTISSIVSVLFLFLISNSAFAHYQMKPNNNRYVATAQEFKMNMRKLWQDHVIWTRNMILCIVDDLPGKERAEKRLLQNQVDLGNALIPYYGDVAGKKLTAILYPHITIAAEVVNALRTGNTIVRDEASKRWYANADELSEYFSNANPKWGLDDMKKMMNNHLRLTTDEAVQRLKKNYEGDIIAFDTINNEILIMADMFADGIIKQFPNKFKSAPTKWTSR